MSRLHRQPRSRNARTEFPEYRALRGGHRRQREARPDTRAGVSRWTLCYRSWRPTASPIARLGRGTPLRTRSREAVLAR